MSIFPRGYGWMDGVYGREDLARSGASKLLGHLPYMQGHCIHDSHFFEESAGRSGVICTLYSLSLSRERGGERTGFRI
jgi:hypothetical protein